MSPKILAWLVRSILRIAVPLTLLGSMAILLAYSVDSANWVRPDHLIVTGIICGFFFGWLLARTRFPTWLVGFYTTDLAILVILISMANIFPLLVPNNNLPFLDILTAMNLRAYLFMQRMGGWYIAINSGNPLNDTGFFLFLSSLLGWSTTTWLVWNVLKKQRAYAGVLPFALLLGLNNHLSQQGVGTFWAFLGLTLLLLVFSTYQNKQLDWDRRNIDYPDSLQMDWAFSALAVTILVTTLSMMVATFGTPAGWKTLANISQDLRKQSEPAAQQLFGGVKAPKFDEPPLFADTPDLSNFANGLPQGDQTIMWVKTSDPPPPPPESGEAANVGAVQHYWRSNVFTVYTSTGWKPEGSFDATAPQRNPQVTPPGRYQLDQEFDIVASHAGLLFAANQPVSSGADTLLLYRTLDDTALLTGSASTYPVSSWVTQVSANDLDAASPNIPPEIASIYLQLPDDLPARVGQLSYRIVADGVTTFEKVLRVQDYLRQTYVYSASTPPPGPDIDFVDQFLFESQTGYCTHFASSMAVMLRTQGIPARVATGYATGSYDYQHEAYRVIASSAHAWVEVFFPGYGWIEFEPTPSQSPFHYTRYTPEGDVIPQPAPPEMEQVKQSQYGWLWVTVGIIFIALLFLLYQRMRHSAHRAAAGHSGILYWRMRRMFAWAGLKGKPSTTPGEFLHDHDDILTAREPLHRSAQNITRLYLQAAFSRRPPVQAEIDHARREWQQSRMQWIRLLAQRILVALRRGKR